MQEKPGPGRAIEASFIKDDIVGAFLLFQPAEQPATATVANVYVYILFAKLRGDGGSTDGQGALVILNVTGKLIGQRCDRRGWIERNKYGAGCEFVF